MRELQDCGSSNSFFRIAREDTFQDIEIPV